MKAMIRRQGLFTCLLWTAVVFAACQQPGGGDNWGAGLEGVLTVSDAADGRRYIAELYAYPTDGVATGASWNDAINESKLLAKGAAVASDGTAGIPLKTPSGAVFNPTGVFVAVITQSAYGDEPAIVKYRPANFNASPTFMGWDTMLVPPDTASGRLSLGMATAESVYVAELYEYKGANITDYSSWSALLTAAPKTASGWAKAASGSEANIVLINAADNSAFTDSGVYLAVVTEANSFNKITVKYKAGAVFTSGAGSFSWREMADAPSAPSGSKGGLTLSGGSASKAYAAEVYRYTGNGSGGKLSGYEYIGYTALENHIAFGEIASPSAGTALISLKTPKGDPFVKEGPCLVVVSEYTAGLEGEVRYHTAVTFDADGKAGLNWMAMIAAPSVSAVERPQAALYLTDSSKGENYRVEVFSYGGGGELSYKDYIVYAHAAARVASGEGAAPLIALKDSAGAPFGSSSAAHIVAVSELTTGTVYYQTAVPFNAGGAILSRERDLRLAPVLYTVTFHTDGGTGIGDQHISAGGLAQPPDPDPERKDYIFGGWYTDKTWETYYGFDKPVISSIGLYAKWISKTVPSYVVSFDTLCDDVNVPSQHVVEGETANPPAPAREGYSFEGWYTDETWETLYDFDKPVTESFTLYAKWTKTHTVTFDPNGGALAGSGTPVQQTVPHDGYASDPGVPYRSGFYFAGWYENEEDETTLWILASRQVTGDVTLTAKWTDSLTVTFDTNGGDTPTWTVLMQVDYPVTRPPTDPTRAGYDFAGWYDGSGPTAALYSFGMPVTEPITIYAKWTIKTYTVTFNSNGGSLVPDQYVQYQGLATAPAAPTRDGYEFAGWYDDNNTFAVPHKFNAPVIGNITIHAKWTPYYTVGLDLAGGAFAGGAPSGWTADGTGVFMRKVLSGGTVSAPAPAPTRDGYDFAGWYDDNNTFAVPHNFTVPVTGNITIHAKWIETHTVTFYWNYGSAGIYTTQTVAHNWNATLPEPEPTRTGGYDFGGWYTAASGGTEYNFSTPVTADIPLYAKWIPVYTVTFYWNYGSAGIYTTQTVAHNGNATPPDPEPTRTGGYAFDGWYKEAGCVNPWSFTADTVTADIQLYAKWIAPHTVTFNLNYGSNAVHATQTVAHNGTAEIPAVPARTGGYDFAGWYKETACVTPWNFTTDTVTADRSLYAKWNPRTLAAAIAYMAETANRPSADYTLQSGSENYNPATAVTLTAGANSPASVVIDGGGRTVTGTTYIPLTVGAGVTLTLKNITFDKVPFKVTAGGTLVLDNGSIIQGNQQHATDASSQSSVTGQFDGTGVHVTGGSLVMRTGSLITGNNHSGVQVFNSGSFTMNGGKISDNRFANARWSNYPGWNGAGVGIISSSFTMTGGTISGNIAPEMASYGGGYGGGVAVMGSGAVFTMSGGTISGNTADFRGGGVDLRSGATFNMSGNALISGNTATYGSGGGVYIWQGSMFNMEGGSISGNEPDDLYPPLAP